MQASAWKAGWTKTTLAEWAVTLLKLVEFRVSLGLCMQLSSVCAISLTVARAHPEAGELVQILPVASILGRQAVEGGNSVHCQHLISSGEHSHCQLPAWQAIKDAFRYAPMQEWTCGGTGPRAGRR